MKRLTIEQIEEIRERAEKATKGASPEWYVDEEYKDTVRCSWSADLIAQCIPTESDAEFIANSRQDIPALLAEVERLRKLAHILVDGYSEVRVPPELRNAFDEKVAKVKAKINGEADV